MRGSIEKTLITGIAIALLSMLAIALVSVWQSRRLQDTAVWIRHTNQVLFQTKEILDLDSRYELGVKNYLLTGDNTFLDSLDVLTTRLQGGILQLKDLTADNALQQVRIDSLSVFVTRDLGVLQQAMALSRGKSIDSAAALVAGSAKAGYSHKIRVICNLMESEEGRLLDQRRRTNQRRMTELNAALWVLSVAVLVLGVIIFRKTRIDLGKERVLQDQLSRFNADLEDQVRRQTEDLQASEEKYKTLFYKSPLPKWIYDQHSLRFLEVNEAALLHYGYSPEEFRSMTIQDIRPPEDRDAVLRDVEDVRLSPESYRHQQWRHLKKDGVMIDVEITAHSFEYAGRKARMVVVSDITERRQSERLLQQLNEDLQKRAGELSVSNAELERFAYIASHDLQEPLRMVSSFLQLLQKRYKGKLDEKADQYIHFAVDGAERMKALIQDLLEYSRVGTGKERFGAVDMGEVMTEVRNIFREKIAESGASIVTDALPVVTGDKVQLAQLLQNLVGNGLKYHSELPAVIAVRVEDRPEYWQFAVEDNGIGIDPQFFEKIFIIFQRLHNRNDYSGTGIGLAICKKIVERHGGRIWVEPAASKGSIFFFTINK